MDAAYETIVTNLMNERSISRKSAVQFLRRQNKKGDTILRQQEMPAAAPAMTSAQAATIAEETFAPVGVDIETTASGQPEPVVAISDFHTAPVIAPQPPNEYSPAAFREAVAGIFDVPVAMLGAPVGVSEISKALADKEDAAMCALVETPAPAPLDLGAALQAQHASAAPVQPAAPAEILAPNAWDAAKVVEMYQAGTRVVDIAVAFGYARGQGQNRVRKALVTAGVYKA